MIFYIAQKQKAVMEHGIWNKLFTTYKDVQGMH